MVEIKHLTVTEGKPSFPKEVWDKKVAVALLDFNLFDAQKCIMQFRDTQERGVYCVTYQNSYEDLLDKLDNKELLKQRWEREAGTLHILPDLKDESVEL